MSPKRIEADSRTLRIALVLVCLAAFFSINSVHAQITERRVLSATPDRFATLDEQLINRLRATSKDQQDYINFVVQQVRRGILDAKLIVAIERYAIRRKRQYPFPYFERALRFEANKRGVALPTVKQFASTKLAPR